MKRSAIWLALVVSFVLLVVVWWPRTVLMVNARVLTMDEHRSMADALLLRGRYIAGVGSEEALRQDLPWYATILDMQGQSLLPGFVDAHSHFPSAGLTRAGLDLTPPPVGTVATMQQLLDVITTSTSGVPEEQWIVGFNYDDASLSERRHPTRDELDQAAPHHPVYLWHRSGHMGVANSKALSDLGYHDFDGSGQGVGTANLLPVRHDAPDRDRHGRLTGLLQGAAAPRLGALLRHLPYSDLIEAVLSARDQYLQAGVTTVQNGFADKPSMYLLRWLQRAGIVPQRIVVWPAWEKMIGELVLTEPLTAMSEPGQRLAKAIGWRGRSDSFSVTALKLVADGSPQGRTAWLTQPYLADAHLPAGFRGVPSMSKATFRALVQRYHSAGLQLAMHGNGDAAIDLIISSLQSAQAKAPGQDTRHIVVHAQTIREDQLMSLAQLDTSITFFPAHTYYWGDWYREHVLGEERAGKISPLALADQAQVQYSIHSDAPVTPVSPMQMLWSATQRKTLTGYILDASLIVSRERALRAMTIDAAWQSYLEHDRGSLQVGKLADVIALSGNPLTEPDVRNLTVERVWIGGRLVFQR